MNEILSVGLVLLFALMAGHGAQRLHVPEVTGYLLVGMLIGPAGLDLVSDEDLRALGFLSDVALGLILFSIGSIFQARTLRRLGRGVALVTAWEAGLALCGVTAGMLALGLELPVALLLGVIAMETAPATTLMVLREYDAKGPMSDRLLALVALNNILVLLVFALVEAGLSFYLAPAGSTILRLAAGSLLDLAWFILGSAALGVLVGLVVDSWASHTSESGEAIILVMGAALVTVGAARQLGLSPLVSALALGAAFANASSDGEHLHEALGRADPPLYAAFFVLAGAELQLANLAAIGTAGLTYVALRAVGKVAGARLALRRQDVPDVVRQHLGFCLISSSSLAIGLTLQVRSTFPELAPAVTGIVLAAVLACEIVGPLLLRRALFKTGEVAIGVP